METNKSNSTQFLALYEAIQGINLVKSTPPPPPYGSKPTLAKVKKAVDSGVLFLPKVFRDGYAGPLQVHLPSVIARALKGGDLVSLETLTGAVYQHAQPKGQDSLRRFLAVISNLYRSFLDSSKRA